MIVAKKYMYAHLGEDNVFKRQYNIGKYYHEKLNI